MRLKRKYRKNYFVEMQYTDFNSLKNMLIEIKKGDDKSILEVTTSNPSSFEWFLKNKLTSYGYKKSRNSNTTKIECKNETNRNNLYEILRRVKNAANITTLTKNNVDFVVDGVVIFKFGQPVKPIQEVIATTVTGIGNTATPGSYKSIGNKSNSQGTGTSTETTTTDKEEETSSTTYIIIAGVILVVIVLLMRKK